MRISPENLIGSDLDEVSERGTEAWSDYTTSQRFQEAVEASGLSEMKISPERNIRNVFLLWVVPLLLMLIVLVIPYQQARQGFVHNWTFLCLGLPLTSFYLIAHMTNVQNIVLRKKPSYYPTFIGMLLVFIIISLIAQFATNFPLPVLNAVVFLLVAIATLRATSVFRSKDAHLKKLLALCAASSGSIFFLEMIYVIAFFSVPSNLAILVTLLHYLVSATLQAISTIQVRVAYPTPAINIMIQWFLYSEELFPIFVLPNVSSDSYFYIVLAVKIVLFFRYPFLLSQTWWNFVQHVKQGADPSSPLYNRSHYIFNLAAQMLPLSLSRGEYTLRMLETFAYAAYSYTFVPLVYLALGPVMKFGHNKHIFFYDEISNEAFFRTLIYAGISSISSLVVSAAISIFIWKQFGLHPFTLAFRRLDANLSHMLISNVNGLVLPLVSLIQQYNVIYWLSKYKGILA